MGTKRFPDAPWRLHREAKVPLGNAEVTERSLASQIRELEYSAKYQPEFEKSLKEAWVKLIDESELSPVIAAGYGVFRDPLFSATPIRGPGERYLGQIVDYISALPLGEQQIALTEVEGIDQSFGAWARLALGDKTPELFQKVASEDGTETSMELLGKIDGKVRQSFFAYLRAGHKKVDWDATEIGSALVMGTTDPFTAAEIRELVYWEAREHSVVTSALFKRVQRERGVGYLAAVVFDQVFRKSLLRMNGEATKIVPLLRNEVIDVPRALGAMTVLLDRWTYAIDRNELYGAEVAAQVFEKIYSWCQKYVLDKNEFGSAMLELFDQVATKSFNGPPAGMPSCLNRQFAQMQKKFNALRGEVLIGYGSSSQAVSHWQTPEKKSVREWRAALSRPLIRERGDLIPTLGEHNLRAVFTVLPLLEAAEQTSVLREVQKKNIKNLIAFIQANGKFIKPGTGVDSAVVAKALATGNAKTKQQIIGSLNKWNVIKTQEGPK